MSAKNREALQEAAGEWGGTIIALLSTTYHLAKWDLPGDKFDKQSPGTRASIASGFIDGALGLPISTLRGR